MCERYMCTCVHTHVYIHMCVWVCVVALYIRKSVHVSMSTYTYTRKGWEEWEEGEEGGGVVECCEHSCGWDVIFSWEQWKRHLTRVGRLVDQASFKMTGGTLTGCSIEANKVKRRKIYILGF